MVPTTQVEGLRELIGGQDRTVLGDRQGAQKGQQGSRSVRHAAPSLLGRVQDRKPPG
jgi:hypothetical protein